MKTIIILFSVCFIMVSCGKDIAVEESESLQVTALTSPEFQEMQNAYNTYHNYKMTEIVRLTTDAKMGRTSSKEYFAQKEMYLQKCLELMKDVGIKTAALRDKYPTLMKKNPSLNLIQELQKGVQ